MFWYLATPYTKYPGGIVAAYIAACKEHAALVRAGVPVFCPISHTHGPAVLGEIDPLDHGVWLPADRPFMDAACGLIMCQLPTWEDSYGMKYELAHFTAAEKPVVWMTPGNVPPELLGGNHE